MRPRVRALLMRWSVLRSRWHDAPFRARHYSRTENKHVRAPEATRFLLSGQVSSWDSRPRSRHGRYDYIARKIDPRKNSPSAFPSVPSLARVFGLRGP
jgi:hypothetical protein